MNSIMQQSVNSGLNVRSLKSESKKIDLPTHGALRKIHVQDKANGESRSRWDLRINAIREDLKCKLDIISDVSMSDDTRKGYYAKSITIKPNGEKVYVMAPPEVDATLAKKLSAMEKLKAEIAALQAKSEVIEVEQVA